MSDRAITTESDKQATVRRSHQPSDRHATADDGSHSSARDRLYEEYLSSARPPRAQAGWTVAIDLTATERNADGSLAGARVKFEQLRSLAAQTRNSPIEFVVQQARMTRAPDSAERVGSSQNNPSRDVEIVLDRYRIRNGQIEPLPSSRSQGMGADITNLLNVAAHESSAARVGLIIQSHGEGPNGVFGNPGRLSLDELRRSVQAGLKGSGHNQLDLLDFDACNMATAEVADSVRSISRAMVGAAEPERASHADGQNLVALGREFINHPNADGITIARGAVRLAGEGANNDTTAGNPSGQSGTRDLEAVDLRNESALNQSLDHLGAALMASRINNNNRAAIDELIRKTHQYHTGENASTGNQDQQMRDLPNFVAGIRDAVDRGLIADPSGRLRAASAEALKMLKVSLPAHFGETENGLDRTGGMSVTLPELAVRDFRAQAVELTTIGYLDSLLHEPEIANSASEPASSLVKSVRWAADEVRAQDPQTAESLEQISRTLQEGPNQQQYDEQLRALKVLVEKIKGTPEFAAEVDSELRELTRLQRARQRHTAVINQAPNWNRFIHSLYDS